LLGLLAFTKRVAAFKLTCLIISFSLFSTFLPLSFHN
jgi:hypothetical protein